MFFFSCCFLLLTLISNIIRRRRKKRHRLAATSFVTLDNFQWKQRGETTEKFNLIFLNVIDLYCHHFVGLVFFFFNCSLCFQFHAMHSFPSKAEHSIDCDALECVISWTMVTSKCDKVLFNFVFIQNFVLQTDGLHKFWFEISQNRIVHAFAKYIELSSSELSLTVTASQIEIYLIINVSISRRTQRTSFKNIC